MSYEKYITEALVCGSTNVYGADKRYQLFTREAGMVYASGKSVREERSKHRFALQDFSIARVSLVRGKQGWRIVGAESERNVYFSATTRMERAYVRNVVALIRRYVIAEVAHPQLFDDVVQLFEHVHQVPVDTLHTLATVRILHQLGYIAPDAAVRTLTDQLPDATALNELDTSVLRACEKAIEQAETASHL